MGTQKCSQFAVYNKLFLNLLVPHQAHTQNGSSLSVPLAREFAWWLQFVGVLLVAGTNSFFFFSFISISFCFRDERE